MAEALNYPDSDFSDDELTPLEKNFNEAANHVRKITSKLNNEQLLELYGLYKQGTEGKCNTPKPGWLDGRGRRKWDAWNTHSGMSLDEAKQKYIGLVQKLDPDLVMESEKFTKETWVAVSSLRRSPEPELNIDELSILDAAREDCGKRVTELLKQNPSLKSKHDEDGLTALHWAADRNATEALSAAITGGCIVDAVDDSGQTALHYAALCGHKTATKILLDAGASPNIKDHENNTPIDLAADDDIKKLLQKES